MRDLMKKKVLFICTHNSARSQRALVGEIALLSWLCSAYDVPTAMITITFLIVP